VRRKAEKLSGYLDARILANFTAKQLELIGSIAIAYNGCEHVLHNTAGSVIGYTADPRVVTTRINGTDGLVAIIIDASMRNPHLRTSDIQKQIRITLQGEGFSTLKTYRDAVVHSMPYNILAGIGRYVRRQAVSYDVLLTESALTWLSNALLQLHEEMGRLGYLIRCADRIVKPDDDTAERKRLLEVDLPHAIARHLQMQNLRRSTSTPPEFPRAEDIPRRWLR
jgi:hypothetical protein